MASPQKRALFEVLVSKREKAIVWCRTHPPPAPTLVSLDGVQLPVAALWVALQRRLRLSGVLHVLLLRLWLHALPEPRLDVARLLMERYAGERRCSYATLCLMWYELCCDAPPRLNEVRRVVLGGRRGGTALGEGALR